MKGTERLGDCAGLRQLGLAIHDGETRTLCRIDTSEWIEKAEVGESELINCPLCAKALKPAAKAAKAEARP
jgi:hypothetical protein